MPRLPTMRVIGSQFISTSLLVSAVAMVAPLSTPAVSVVAGLQLRSIAGVELSALVAPARLLVEGLDREVAQRPDDGAVNLAGLGRHPRSRRLVHERHELVGEAGHRAADADAADVGAAADAAEPAALGHVALHDRPPAAELDDALG